MHRTYSRSARYLQILCNVNLNQTMSVCRMSHAKQQSLPEYKFLPKNGVFLHRRVTFREKLLLNVDFPIFRHSHSLQIVRMPHENPTVGTE